MSVTSELGSGLDRRERKKLATRRALANAARELTLARGLDAVTVDDIAAAADVSPRTFFNYFSSKEQAIVGVDPDVLDDFADALVARPADESPVEALWAVIVGTEDEIADVARRWVMRTELVRRYPSLVPRHLEGLIEVERALIRAMAARLSANALTDLYPTTVVACVLAAVRSTMTWWHGSGETGSLPAALDAAYAQLVAGFGGTPKP